MDVSDETTEGEFESGGEASPALKDDWDNDVAQESARKKRSVATKNYTLFQELTARMRAPRSASPRRAPPNTNNHGAVGENEFNFTNDDPDAEREAKRVADGVAAEAKRLLTTRIAPSVSDRFPNLSVRHFSETLGHIGNGWVRDEMMEAYQVMLIE